MKRDPIPQLDLKAQYDGLKDEIAAAIDHVLAEQKFILGPEVGALEREVAAFCGAPFAVGCASGSDALILALMALDVRPGDAVVCPTYTFFATAGAVWRLGARAIFADLDPATYNLSAESLERALRGQRAKALIPVHLFGQACPVEVEEAAARHGLAIVHDAAQAIGCVDDRGRRMGGTGLTCFSFFPSKNLGCYGDGGMLTTPSAEQAERLRRLRAHGAAKKYFHDEVGMNSRLDTLQAAVLRVKLPHLDEWNAGRAAVAAAYDERFRAAGAADSRTPLAAGGLPLRTPARLGAPAVHVYNQYVVRVPAAKRDALRERLGERGIGSAIYYPKPLHLQPCFAALGYRAGDLPESEAAADETLALPIFPELRRDQIDRVVGEVVDFLRQ